MSIFLFADESGTSASEPCYSIGALLIPETLLDEFNREFSRLVDVHGVVGEVRWTKVAKSHGLMNLAIDLLRYVISSGLCFNCIVVLKDPYNKWKRGTEDAAFYTTYGLLLSTPFHKFVHVFLMRQSKLASGAPVWRADGSSRTG